ncbi:MAG TPA: hypothetical protein VH720_14695 [Candidatus Limnocylindrales bacterium]|jgi:hypothetical protein
MHPHVAYELAKLRMAEAQADAARERLVRAANPRRPQPIDAVGLRERLSRLLNGLEGVLGSGQPGTAGA